MIVRPHFLAGFREHRLLFDAETPHPEDNVPKPELLQNAQSAETKELLNGREELKKAYESPTSFAERRVAGYISKADEDTSDTQEDVVKAKKHSKDLENQDMVANAAKDILIPGGGILTPDAKTSPESVVASKQQAGAKAETAEAEKVREVKVIAPESPDMQAKAGARGITKEKEKPAVSPVSPEAAVKEGEYPKIKKEMDDAMAVLRSEKADLGEKAEAFAVLLGGIFKLSLRMSSYVRGVDPDTNERIEKRDDKKPVELVKNPKKEIEQIEKDDLYGERKKKEVAQRQMDSLPDSAPEKVRAELTEALNKHIARLSTLQERKSNLGNELKRREAEIPKDLDPAVIESIALGKGGKPNDWDDLQIVFKDTAALETIAKKIERQEGVVIDRAGKTIRIDPPEGFWANKAEGSEVFLARIFFEGMRNFRAPEKNQGSGL